MNILIKLMSIVSLVLAPTLADVFDTKATVDEDRDGAKNKIEVKKVVEEAKSKTTTATF
jgi:hypothetical protein